MIECCIIIPAGTDCIAKPHFKINWKPFSNAKPKVGVRNRNNTYNTQIIISCKISYSSSASIPLCSENGLKDSCIQLTQQRRPNRIEMEEAGLDQIQIRNKVSNTFPATDFSMVSAATSSKMSLSYHM